MTTAHVSHAATGLELRLDPVEGRNPAGGQVLLVARAEEPLAALEHIGVMLAPAHAAAAAERFHNARLGTGERVHHLESTDHRAQNRSMLGGQAVVTAGRIVVDVATG